MTHHSGRRVREEHTELSHRQTSTAARPPRGPLPPGFAYTLSPIETVSPPTAAQAEHALILAHVQRHGEAPDPAIIDLYPQRQRVRVRRHKRTTPRLWWGLLAFLIVGGIIGGGIIYGRGSGVFDQTAMPQADAPLAAAAAGEEGEEALASSAVTVPAADPVHDLRTSDNAVIAKAVIKPLRAVALGFTVGGRVKELLTHEGAVVVAGQPLLRLDDTRQLVAVAQARAGLQQAQAQLLDLQVGARLEEIAVAQAVVDGAQARLDTLLQDSVQVADEAAAQAEIAAAEAQLQQLYNGPAEESLIAARAAMHQAEAALATAQAAYDAVVWRSDIAMLPESTQLQQATIALEAAQATYTELARGANAAEISAALSALETARANLARVRKPVQNGEIEAARAALRQAQAELDLLRAGARAEVIAAAQAGVSAAQATLLEAEAALDETLLTAPFVGTVAALDVEVGEQVGQGVPVVQLGDFSTWQLETDDLVELDVVRVKSGAPVAVTIDALPGVELRGEVVRVKPIGENKVGDMTYTAYIALDKAIAALAWNMTATVYIGGN